MTAGSIVVLGGGLAALSFIDALRSRAHTAPVTVVDPAAFAYDRPPLSKGYLAGTRSAADITLADAGWFAARDVTFLGGRRAVRVTPKAEAVMIALDDGSSLNAETVVLALGADAVLPPVPGLRGDRVHVLRDLPDADRLRSALTAGARLLVVGAGLIGAEVASTAVALGVDVTVIDLIDVPLEAAVGRETASWLHGLHRARGVETRRAGLERLGQAADGAVAATLKGAAGPRGYDAVLVCVGAEPRTDLAVEAGLDVDGGILVDCGQRTSHPRVLAIGDCSRQRGERRAEHREAAKLSGERAAATLTGAEVSDEPAPWFWTDRYGIRVEAAGDASSADSVRRVRRGNDKSWSVLSVGDGRVIGAVCVDDAATMRVVRRLIDKGVPVDASALEDPATDLRTLLRT